MLPQLPRPAREYNWHDKIISMPALSRAMCQSLINYAKEPHAGLHKGIAQHTMWESSFDTTQLPINHPVHDTLQSVLKQLVDHFKFEIDFIEEYEIKCYREGDFFDKHTDCSYSLKNDLERKITISINLSDTNDYEGGLLRVMDKEITRDIGSITAFPSFFPHRVYPITQGERWSLVSWAWGPYWR